MKGLPLLGRSATLDPDGLFPRSEIHANNENITNIWTKLVFVIQCLLYTIVSFILLE